MRILLVLALLQVASAGEPLRSGCSPDDGQLATVGASDQVKVLLAVAGWDSPCYKVRVTRPGGNMTGYVLGSAMPAIREFEHQREEASAAASQGEARLALAQAAAAQKSAETDTDKPKDPLISTQFEDFSGRDSNGKPVNLSGLKGRATLVTFWSPTGGHAEQQVLSATRLYDEFHRSGLAAVGISMNPNPNRIGAALDDVSPNWPQMPDRNGLAAHYNVDPRAGKVFVLDANHRIVAAGPMGPEIEKTVRQLLAAP
jgi:hypothetical protein